MPQSISLYRDNRFKILCVFQVLKTNKKINLYFPESDFNWRIQAASATV